MKDTIYLDYAAATPLDTVVLEAMRPYLGEKFYNPSALYLAAKDVATDLAGARGQIAALLGARPAEIFFTAGGTEANNLALNGIRQKYSDGGVIVSAVEHESVLEPACLFQNHQEAPVLADGRVGIEALYSLIDDNTVLVSIMYANNEIGTIQPVSQVAQLIQRVRAKRQKAGNKLPIYLHTDAAQAANYMDLHTSRLGVDLMTINGGKIYGPKQSGLLYIRTGVDLAPQILGGGQERGLRSGTENVAGVIGLAKALEIAARLRHDEAKRLQKLQKLFFDLLQTQLPTAQINGSRKHRLPNNVHLTISGQDNERLIMLLDEKGIMAAAGSACSASNEEPSHVLKAIGLTETQARASLRFTMGRQTTETDIRRTVEAMIESAAPNAV